MKIEKRIWDFPSPPPPGGVNLEMYQVFLEVYEEMVEEEYVVLLEDVETGQVNSERLRYYYAGGGSKDRILRDHLLWKPGKGGGKCWRREGYTAESLAAGRVVLGNGVRSKEVLSVGGGEGGVSILMMEERASLRGVETMLVEQMESVIGVNSVLVGEKGVGMRGLVEEIETRWTGEGGELLPKLLVMPSMGEQLMRASKEEWNYFFELWQRINREPQEKLELVGLMSYRELLELEKHQFKAGKWMLSNAELLLGGVRGDDLGWEVDGLVGGMGRIGMMGTMIESREGAYWVVGE